MFSWDDKMYILQKKKKKEKKRKHFQKDWNTYFSEVFGLCCGMQDAHPQHVGSSSQPRDWTWAPCIGSAESQPQARRVNPSDLFLNAVIQLRSPHLMEIHHQGTGHQGKTLSILKV